jgi:CBS domain-containing protein
MNLKQRVTASDLMQRRLFTCPPEARLGHVARLLSEHNVHALIVAEGDGPPLGILSDTDLLAGEWLAGDPEALAAMRKVTARELMTAPVLTIPAEMPAAQVAARMGENQVHRLLVTEAGRAVGVVSVSDFVAGLAAASAERRTVGDVMSRGLVVCRAETPVPALARLMTERRTRSVVVVGPTGQPLGVVTGLDVMQTWLNGNGTVAADLMHPPITVGPQALLSEAVDLMLRHHIHRLVVLDPAEAEAMPLGLISSSDILAEMAAPGSAWQA